MRILILNAYYGNFLAGHAREHPQAADWPYAQQLRLLLDACFGTADFYSANLRSRGHHAEEIVFNAPGLQLAWCREHVSALARSFPGATDGEALDRWLREVLLAQVRAQAPEVIFVQDVADLPADFLRTLRNHCRLLAGQCAFALPPGLDLTPFGLLLSSFPHFVSQFRAAGIPAEYLALGFEPAVLSRLGAREVRYGTVFVGGFGPVHATGTACLEAAARQVPVDVWGYGFDHLPPDAALRQRLHGEAFGLPMYRILRSAGVALNRHSTAAQGHANNMRLFEATGAGACLLTDKGLGLDRFFVEGREIWSFSTPEECADMAVHLASHPREREAVAAAGQARTLHEHTYARRMEELEHILQRGLA